MLGVCVAWGGRYEFDNIWCRVQVLVGMNGAKRVRHQNL